MTTFLVLAALVFNSFLVTPPSLPGKKADSGKYTKLASAPKTILPDPFANPPEDCAVTGTRIGDGAFGSACSFSSGGCSPECNSCVVYKFTITCSCCIDEVDITSDSGNCFYVCGRIHGSSTSWSSSKSQCDNTAETLTSPTGGSLCAGNQLDLKICCNHALPYGLNIFFKPTGGCIGSNFNI